MAARLEPLNLNPIGPGHVYWPNGSPVKKAPQPGMYAFNRGCEAYYRRKEYFSKGKLAR